MKNPWGWEIVWREEGRALPLGGQRFKVRRREPVKARKWEQGMKFRLGIGRGGTGREMGWKTTSYES